MTVGKVSKNTLLRVIPTMTFIHFLTGILSDMSFFLAFYLAFYLTYLLAFYLSGKSSGISSGILSGISSSISCGVLSGISSGICSCISFGILFFRPAPDGSRQVVYQAGKTIALCKFTELLQWQHQS